MDHPQTSDRQFSLRCLGVGDGWPSDDRNHSSYLYRFGNVSLLVDCGEPVSRGLQMFGVSCDEIDHIFISHLHCDHIGGFFMLMQSWWLLKRRKELRIHLPGYAIQPVRQMLQASYAFDELFACRVHYEPLAAGQPVNVQGVLVTPFPTTHLDQFRTAFASKYSQPFEAYSFLIESDRLRVAHSADIGAVEDLAPLLRKPVDLLVCEVAHVEPEVLFRSLSRHAIKRALFIHVSRGYWENLDRLQAQAAELLKGISFSFAVDGEEVTL